MASPSESAIAWERLARDIVTSRTNPVVKRMRGLRQPRVRSEERAFVVEGILPVWRAVEHGAGVEILVVAPELLHSEKARLMIAGQALRGLRVTALSADLFEHIAGREHPSGIAAIVSVFSTQLADLKVTADSIFAAFHTPGNPGNLGTSLRTIDAIGGAGAILIGGGTDAFHPNAVKASMGTLFTLPVVSGQTWEHARDWFRSQHVSIVTTSSHAEADFWSVRLPRPCVYVIGNEGEGLPRDVLDDGDLAIRIPMAHGGSLNMAVATAVTLYEAKRQSGTGRQT